VDGGKDSREKSVERTVTKVPLGKYLQSINVVGYQDLGVKGIENDQPAMIQNSGQKEETNAKGINDSIKLLQNNKHL
jgi:hypothetical protein